VKKTKSIIIVLIILVILIIIAMLIISALGKKEDAGSKIINNNANNITSNIISNIPVLEDNELEGEERIDAPDERVTEEHITLLKNHNTFFSIEKLISRYFLYLRAGNSDAVYDIIEKSYKDENGINKQNAIEILRTGNQYNGNYTSKEVYLREDNYKPIYFITGTLEKDKVRTSCYFIMKQDKINVSFTLKPITEEEYKMYLNESKIETFEEDIELNKYNKIMNTTLTEEEIARKYFNSYIQNARYYPEEAYNLLDEKYRNAKFGNYQKFIEYLTGRAKSKQLENLDPKSIKDITEFNSEDEYREYMANLNKKSMRKYDYSKENDKEYYICIDDYDNFYIFEVSGAMKYKVYLDTYTIDLDYFINQYNKEDATTKDKIERNVEKILEALNIKDYEYVYKKLDNSLRNQMNYNEFYKNIDSILFDNSYMEIKETTENNDSYTYKIIITDRERKVDREIEMVIVVELTQENDFTIKNMKLG